MRTLIASTALLALLGFASCKQAEGCTDPSSLNFNQDARLDDGSCLYFADAYVGTYLADDSLQQYNPLDSTWANSRRQYSLVITKVNRGVVSLGGFNNNGCSPRAEVTLTTLDLESPMTDCGISNFLATFDDGVLTYSYVFDTLMPTNVTGVATWQQ